MSRLRVARKGLAKATTEKREWPAVVYFWMIGLAFVSYVVARIALDGYPHPYHWLSGLIGGIIGIGVGWLWFRWRGDIF